MPPEPVDVPVDEQTAREIREATLALPVRPGGGSQCPPGEFDFTDGRALIEQGESSGDTWEYVILPEGDEGLVGDVDHSQGDEFVVMIGCGGPELHFGLLALVPEESGFRPLGYVMVAEGVADGPTNYWLQAGEVVVASESYDGSPEIRWYRWDGSQFVQVVHD
jgi:hypothetical protein